jgi:hypothetical protein
LHLSLSVKSSYYLPAFEIPFMLYRLRNLYFVVDASIWADVGIHLLTSNVTKKPSHKPLSDTTIDRQAKNDFSGLRRRRSEAAA